MNIFVTSDDPAECARNLDNKRVVKMILESAQMLSTAMNLSGAKGPYKSTHVNHPCTVWARASSANYYWLLTHFRALCDEYSHRYGKIHKCNDYYPELSLGGQAIPAGDLTPFANCSKFKDIETKLAYRLTMISKWTTDEENKRPPKWTNCSPPDWLLP